MIFIASSNLNSNLYNRFESLVHYDFGSPMFGGPAQSSSGSMFGDALSRLNGIAWPLRPRFGSEMEFCRVSAIFSSLR